MAPPTRIVMLGTGDFALPTFEHLCETGHHVVALVTQPDRPQGRKQELIPSRIKLAAQARGVPVFQPEDVNAADAVAAVRGLGPDLLVTAAYGQILSPDLLAVPRLGGINLHGSVLPAYRGAAPVARAIQRGETESGVTVILMSPRVDAGGMIRVAKTPIGPDETAGELEERLAVLGAPLVAEAVAALEAGTAEVMTQARARVTKAPKLRKEDGLIDWSRPSRAVHDLVRAMQPWPTAYTYLAGPRWRETEPLRVIVHKTQALETDTARPPGAVIEADRDRLVVAAGRGAVRLLTVQLPGKKAIPTADFVRGYASILLGHSFLPGPAQGSQGGA
ncbi:MAG: methionyl-tRNA formyltransferase [Planctomycetia bacterium]|nr:methionyl-tRNA formyltransferase [Planctomycetia bacterium]